MLLVISYSSDEHLPIIEPFFDDNVRFLFCDKPFKVASDVDSLMRLEQDGGCFVVDPTWTIWTRRPFWTPGPENSVQEFCRLELRSSITQALMSVVPMGNWVNWPYSSDIAQEKLTVLNIARECGLNVPRHIVSNDLNYIETFSDNEFIVKPSRVTNRVGQIVPGVVYARPFNVAQIKEMVGSAHMTPVYIQEYIRKVSDWRVSFIDGEYQACSMKGVPDGDVDFRMHYDLLNYEGVRLPSEVETALCRLMQRLGLRYGAIDFVESGTGELFFLEVNPHGQFGWLEKSLGSGPNDFAKVLAEVLLA